MKITIRTIIKNILALAGVFTLITFALYDDEDTSVIWKLIVICSPLFFSNLVIYQRRYEEEMQSNIKSKALRNFMTYIVFENFSIILLLFLNVSMLTGIAYKYFGFGSIVFIYILFLYLILIPILAKLIQILLFKILGKNQTNEK